MSDLRLTTILKTDLRGSTAMFRSMTDSQLREFLNEQKSLISRLVVEYQGQIVKGEGDAFWTVFPGVTIATQAAIRIQEEMLTRQVGMLEEERTAVRIIIAIGDVLYHEDDIFGYGVNLTARIEGITPANEIYLSQAAWLVLNQAEIATALVGEFSFKGVDQPEKIYKVLRSQRTIHLSDQVIVAMDLRRFSTYTQSASISDMENLLVILEKNVKAACEENGGAIRVTGGDTFIISFPEVSRALTAVSLLCQRWDAFIGTNHIPCPLAIGVHCGEMFVFRMFAYGEDIHISFGLSVLSSQLWPEATQCGVVVSGKIRDMAVGMEWEEQMDMVAGDKLRDRLRQAVGTAFVLVGG